MVSASEEGRMKVWDLRTVLNSYTRNTSREARKRGQTITEIYTGKHGSLAAAFRNNESYHTTPFITEAECVPASATSNESVRMLSNLTLVEY